MATYDEQIASFFNEAKAKGIADISAYNQVKNKLTADGKLTALNALDNYYNTLTGNNKTTTSTSTPTVTTTANNVGTGDWIYDKNADKYEQQIRDAMAKYPGKSQQEIMDAINKRISSSNLSADALASANKAAQKVFGTTSTQNTTTNKDIGMTKSMPDINTKDNMSSVDDDFAKKIQEQVDAIRKEYDTKIKNQQEYADNIKKLYDANKLEFDAKYGNIRESIAKMESSADDTRNQISEFMANTYEDGMKRIATQQAGRHAAISGKASASGVSADIVANALSEADNDPSTMAAIEALKDKQIANLTNLQTNYSNWYNQIVNQKSGLVGDEKALADALLAKKDALDSELKEIKALGITSAFKPIQDYYNESNKSATADQIKKEKTDADIKRYTSASPEARKDILSDKLFNYSPSVDRALISEEDMKEAVTKGSLMDAVFFLTGKITDKANKDKLNEIAAQLGNSGSSSSSTSTSGTSTPTGGTSTPTGGTSTPTGGTSTPTPNVENNKSTNDEDFKNRFLKLSTSEKQAMITKARSTKGVTAEDIAWMESKLGKGSKEENNKDALVNTGTGPVRNDIGIKNPFLDYKDEISILDSAIKAVVPLTGEIPKAVFASKAVLSGALALSKKVGVGIEEVKKILNEAANNTKKFSDGKSITNFLVNRIYNLSK